MAPPFDPHEILARATGDDWRFVFEEVDLLAREGRWDELGLLRAAAGERAGGPCIAVRERIENRAAASPEGARALASWLGGEPSPRAAELADRLAQERTWAEIAPCGFREDVLLLAAHARVLRREDLSADPAARAARDRAGRRGEPAGVLPLVPLALERSALLPVFTPGGMTWSLPFGPHAEGFQPVVPSETAIEARRLDPADLPAFDRWDRWGAATGHPPAAPSPAAAASAFAALLPEAGAEAASVRAREITAAEAWAVLLCGALAGDRGERRGIAEGRLAAWRTLAALAATPWTGDPAPVGSAVEASHWFLLDVESAWFGRKARDAALVGRLKGHWAALAATE